MAHDDVAPPDNPPAEIPAREAALREVLDVINRSRDDETPVFDAILRNAAGLCDATQADLDLVDPDGRNLREVATWGDGTRAIPSDYWVWPMDSDFKIVDCVKTGQISHTPDLRDTDKYREGNPMTRAAVDSEGMLTVLVVPLVSDGAGVGCIVLFRQEVRPFSAEEIALAETFAAQAVIAIENVRQFREVQTRLEREAATSEVLQVISESRADHQRVFDILLEKTIDLLASDHGSVWLISEDGAWVEAVARREQGAEIGAAFDRRPINQADSVAASVVRDAQIWKTDDLQATEAFADPDHANRVWMDKSGARSMLAVPLISDGCALGLIAVYRRRVDPYTHDQAALLQNFAAQAVIAIENVRQFREVQTRLEREAASREILQVISASRTDPAPVFDVILKNAAHLSGAPFANLCLLNESGQHWHLVAHHGDGLRHLAVGEAPRRLDSDLVPGVAIRTAQVVHIEDLVETEMYQRGDPGRVAMVEEEGMRTILGVPLVSEAGAIGCITLFRREVKPFTDDEIALVEGFAAQAVIAIENVQQFNEVQNRLERETATKEILGVISQSRDSEAPVFDKILQSARHLCVADTAGLLLGRPEDKHLRLAALNFADADVMARANEIIARVNATDMEMDPKVHLAAQAICTGEIVHIDDLRETDSYRSGEPTFVEMADEQGHRTTLCVPLRDASGPIGSINLHRTEVQPFSDEEIALVEAFAAQAVIAIENVRQFREVQTRLDRETATKNILRVISQSRDDEVPVFNEILKSASELCHAPLAFLSLANAERTHVAIPAYRGTRSEFGNILDGFEEPITRTELVAVRPIADGQVLRADDITDDDVYRSGDVRRIQMADVEGARSVMSVPLLRDGASLGAIVLYRRSVAPFSDDDVALVQGFAAQAVIAIENVRQFREVQTRLEREAATKDVLHVISQSRDDEMPVFETILKQAERLCHADTSGLQMLTESGAHLQMVLASGQDRGSFQPGHLFDLSEPLNMCVAARERRVVHGKDLKNDDLYRQGHPGRRALVDDEGVLTQLAVPLVKGETVIGTMTLSRLEQKPFSTDEIALVETFAAQAVIAIENVRQFREVQDRLEREQASREILSVISQSRDDESPVFNIILDLAARLCNAPFACLFLANDDRTHLTIPSFHGARSQFVDLINSNPLPMDPEQSLTVQSMIERRPLQIADARDQIYSSGQPHRVHAVEVEGIRTLLTVPLLTAGDSLGVLFLYRREVAPFSDDEISLVQTFANQAVIAIENVRQFREVQDRLEREKASGEVLDVISRSRSDDLPVFDVILENAARLCGASNTNLTLLNETGDAVRLVASHGREILSLVVGKSEWKLDEAISVSEALTSGKPIHIPDYADTQSYRDGSNKLRVRLVDEDGIRSSLAVPLMGAEGALGTLMLHRDAPGAFSAAQVSLVTSFAAQAVIAIENVRQFRALETLNAELGDRVEAQVGELERMGKLKRFLPEQVADAVVSSGDDSMLSSHRALISALFCDIRGFTAFCETAEPEETIEVLQAYHEEMGKLIAAHGAGVDHRAGDGIMVLFNDPLPCDDPAGDALRLAFAMRETMEGLCKRWRKLGHRLGFGVGISLGYATVGMVGSEGRFHYTASGTAVNLAARLCDMASDGEILLSPRAHIAVEEDIDSELVGEVEIKGISAPVEVYRALATKA